jgi:multiple sugar transport system permease protein
MIRRPAEFVLRIVLYVFVIIGAFIYVVPFYWMIRTAIMPARQIYLFPPEWIPEEIQLQHFATPFKAFPFDRWFLNSAIIATTTVLGVVLSASLVGFGFARLRFPLRGLLFTIVLATMILPEQVRLIPTYLLFVQLEWVNTFLPLVVPAWLAPAFHVFLLRQFFMTIPQDMVDAAYIDGCSPLGVYWHVALPASLPALGVCAVFSFSGAWNDFLYPLLYLTKTNVYSVAIGLRLFQSQLATNMQAMMAAATLSALPMITLFFLAQRYFVQGIVITGVKG